jgi:hypothetical protein
MKHADNQHVSRCSALFRAEKNGTLVAEILAQVYAFVPAGSAGTTLRCLLGTESPPLIANPAILHTLMFIHCRVVIRQTLRRRENP